MNQQTNSLKEDSLKPVYPIHKKLKLSFVAWLMFRVVGIGMVLPMILANQSLIAGVVFWQLLWLIPAFCCTPYIIKGKSPYALLLISMFMLIYAGVSGFRMFVYGFGEQWLGALLWLIDFCLLLSINLWLFILLKRLPKMNG